METEITPAEYMEFEEYSLIQAAEKVRELYTNSKNIQSQSFYNTIEYVLQSLSCAIQKNKALHHEIAQLNKKVDYLLKRDLESKSNN